MEIAKSEIYDKNIRFKDAIATPCRMRVDQDGTLRLAIYGPISSNVFFLQEDIKSLLPYLQSFAETGILELPPQKIPLQGVTLAEAFEPGNLLRLSAEQNVKIYEQEKRIKKLENFVRIWREMAVNTYGDNEHLRPDGFARLSEKTSKLLGEEDDSAS